MVRKTIRFTPQQDYKGGEAMCTAASCVMCCVASDFSAVDEDDLSTCSFYISQARLDKIMKVGLKLYNSILKSQSVAGGDKHWLLSAFEVVSFIDKKTSSGMWNGWKFSENISFIEVGGKVGGVYESDFSLPSLMDTVRGLEEGCSLALTVNSHTTACGRDHGSKWWWFDSGHGCFLSFGNNLCEFLAFVSTYFKNAKEFSGTRFSPKSE
jgi:hypothetical protein